MKKSIKTIAAALSAAVLAALPVSNALTANAAIGDYVCRTTAFSKETKSSFTYNLDIKCCRKGSLRGAGYKIGMIGGSLGTAHGGGSQTGTFIDVPFNTPSTGIKRGIIMTFTSTTSNSKNPEQLLYGVDFNSYGNNVALPQTAEKTVRLGDITTYIEGNPDESFDGLTARDALFITYLINSAFGTTHNDSPEPGRCINLQTDYFGRYSWAYLTSNSSGNYINGQYVKMDKISNALLAADINNDGWITQADSTAILLRLCNPDRYPDFMVFNEMPAEDINSL